MNIQEVGCAGMDWIDLAQDRDRLRAPMNAVMNLRFPYNSGNFFEGKRPLGRPRLRWEYYIKMNLQEVGCGGMDWIDLAQVRDRRRAPMNAVMKLRFPYNAGNFLTNRTG